MSDDRALTSDQEIEDYCHDLVLQLQVELAKGRKIRVFTDAELGPEVYPETLGRLFAVATGSMADKD